MTAPSPIAVYCLCAGWCRVCDGFAPTWAQAIEALGLDVRTAWVDIEDHPAATDAPDVETFPTLLVTAGGRVAFVGPVRPQAEAITALVDTLRRGDGAALMPASALAPWQPVADALARATP